MTYAIRPAGPEDAAGITALRRMPGVFEQAASPPAVWRSFSVSRDRAGMF